MDYLKLKWEDKLPQANVYIKIMLNANIPYKIIDICLDLIAYNSDPIFLEVIVGNAIANKLYRIKAETRKSHARKRIPYKYGKHSY